MNVREIGQGQSGKRGKKKKKKKKKREREREREREKEKGNGETMHCGVSLYKTDKNRGKMITNPERSHNVLDCVGIFRLFADHEAVNVR